MSDRPWWSHVLQWTLWVVVMTAVMGWLGRSRFRLRPEEDRSTLRHPTSTLVLGLVCFCFFAALTVLSARATNGNAPWWATALFAGFAAMSVFMILDYFMAVHRVSKEGLAYRKLSGSSGFLRWPELREIRYGSTMKWFRLETTDGAVVRISVMLMGLPEFAHTVLELAPEQAADSTTLQILRDTAAGHPPSVWG